MRKDGRPIGSVGRLAAAALLTFCLWSICYPELSFPEGVCQREDGNEMEAKDYEKLLEAPEGRLRIAFSFSGTGERGRAGEPAENPTEAEDGREEKNRGRTGIQGEARRGF